MGRTRNAWFVIHALEDMSASEPQRLPRLHWWRRTEASSALRDTTVHLDRPMKLLVRPEALTHDVGPQQHRIAFPAPRIITRSV